MSATNLNTVTAELPQIPKPRELVDQRLALQANGYDPIPVLGAHLRATDAGKRPTMSGWQTSRNVDPEVIRGWSASQSDQADCTNTGILCGKIVGVDIDVLNIELSGKLSALAQEILGSSSLRRIGRAPKVLFCYRVETPHEKCSTQELFFGDDPTDKTAKAQVEILAKGQQFVAFGIHPDTRQLYQWSGKSPLDVHASDVPLTTLEKLKQFVEEAEGVLRDAGGRTANEIRAAQPTKPALGIGQQAAALVRAPADTTPPAAVPTAESFFKKVNQLALVSLSDWVPNLFGEKAKFQQSSGAYRVSSKNLGRDLEEDLSISQLGIKDWGVWDQGDHTRGARMPINLVIEHKPRGDSVLAEITPAEAALWLCDQMGMPPDKLGWNGGSKNNLIKIATQQKPIIATPYVWRDPETIPQREWLYGQLLVRKIVSATISPGGIGKSSLVAAEALAMVSGQPLLGVSPPELLRVWLWNLEDPQEETERKIQAAAKHYGLRADDIGDRLLIDSGRDQKLVIATTTRDGAVIAQPVVDSLVSEIIARKIDVLVIDPFVSCHEVAENDNSAMDMVVKEWGRVAERGNCAVLLVHHTRKMGEAAEVTTESSRGGSSQTDACRVVRTVNRMTKQEATNAGVYNHRLYFRTYNDKANFAPPVERSDWFKLESVDLGNGPMGLPGDSIGVVVNWDWPDATAGMTAADYDKVVAEVSNGKWRQSIQANDWVGVAIANALDLDLDVPSEKAKVKAALRMYLDAKTLVVVERKDEDQRKSKKFVEVPSRG